MIELAFSTSAPVETCRDGSAVPCRWRQRCVSQTSVLDHKGMGLGDIYIYTYIHMYTYICIHTYMEKTCIHIHTHACIRTYMSVYMDTYVHTKKETTIK